MKILNVGCLLEKPCPSHFEKGLGLGQNICQKKLFCYNHFTQNEDKSKTVGNMIIIIK